MHDPEKFIECVRQNPAIWDKTSKDYVNRICKDLCWINIGKILFSDWLEVTAEEREQRTKDMKNKWRNMRDSYTKFMNQDRTPNIKEKKNKTYVYADSMSFLQENFPKSSLKREELEEDEEEFEIKHEEVTLDEEDTSHSISPPPSQSPQQPVSSDRPFRRFNARSRSSKVVTGIRRPPFKKQNEEQLDSDKEFLLSILPDYKMLSYQQKLDFRMYTLGFFKRVNLKKSA